jgi:hypothetical protein
VIERPGPYLRALRAGLQALAPHSDFVPLALADATLHALDPALSGTILAPAEAEAATNMPSFAWLTRARAEQALVSRGGPAEPGLMARARQLDPTLAARLEARARLHAFLAVHPLLPATSLHVDLARVTPDPVFALTYDRVAPDGRWSRVRARVRGNGRSRRHGPLVVVGRTGVSVEPGLQHLLTRHFATPLLVLREQLAVACGVEVERLSRTWIGPYWTPGCDLPPEAPAGVERGLVVHLSSEVVARDVATTGHRDPWLPPPPGERVPAGHGVYRDRRFAASVNVVELLRDWGASGGLEVPVVRLG